MIRKRIFFRALAALLFFPALSLAQEGATLPPVEEAMLEELAENSETGPEDDEWWQQVESLRRRPLNPNRITEEELNRLGTLNPGQVQSFLQYRRVMGDFISLYELQAVPGLELSDIRRMLPFLKLNTAGDSYSFKDYFRQGEHSLLLRYARVLEKAKGYQVRNGAGPHYLGDPAKIFLRYRYYFTPHLSYGITADKDAGEEFFSGTQPAGFDFYSAHFFIRNYKTLQALAIGDFSVNMGQGLINWHSLAFGKGASVLNIKRSSPLLQPYTSAGEVYFFRGAGAAFQSGRWGSGIFISHKPIDAGIMAPDSLDHSEETVSSLITTGYHRSLNEIANKNALLQTSAGGNIRYSAGTWSAAFNLLHHHFSKPLLRKEELYNQFVFSGDRLTNASLSYSATFRNLHLFGETAMSGNGASATVNGLLLSVDPRADLGLLYRNFDKAYQSLYANAFSEYARPQDEAGLYAAISLKLSRQFRVEAYSDFFSSSWLRYRVNAPANGNDHLIGLSYLPSKKFSSSGRYRLRHKPVNSAGVWLLKPVENSLLQEGRLQAARQWSRNITHRGAAGVKYYQTSAGSSTGWLFYQDILYKKPGGKWNGSLRVAWFHADSYDSRLYAYENDVLFAYSVPFFYGEGMRYYANLHYKISRRLEAWFRFAQTVYVNAAVSGSGWEEIAGNKKSEIRGQLRYSFKK